VNFLDVAGAEALAGMARSYRKMGGGLYLIRPKEEVIERLERGGYMDDVGWENVFHSKTTAVRTIYRKLDYDICRACSNRVFVECARLGKQEPDDREESEPQRAAAP
jgi:SulP family sulfate permease